MKLSLLGWLIVGLITITLAGGFFGFKWLTAKADCRTQMEKSARIAVEQERERAGKAEKSANVVFVRVRGEVKSSLQTLAEAQAKRTATIRATSVSGECRMPALPTLRDAVKEARDAAAD